MSQLKPRSDIFRQLCAFSLLTYLTVPIVNCAIAHPLPTGRAIAHSGIVTNPWSQPISVVRYGRYTLIELVPELAQQDLMQQVVEVTIPQQLDTHVGDAMRHVLRRSGYRLCETEEAASLYALPLPAAHLRLGPLILRDALLVLAGPAWELAVDDAVRQVCFVRNGALLTIDSAPVSHAEGEQPQEAQP